MVFSWNCCIIHCWLKPSFILELDWNSAIPLNKKILKVANKLYHSQFERTHPQTEEEISQLKQSVQDFMIDNADKIEEIYGHIGLTK